MSRRWTPALATTTALAVLAATGGLAPSAAMIGGQPERATAYLTPSPQQRTGDLGADFVTAPDVVSEAGTRAGLAQDTANRSRVRLVQSSSQRDVLHRFAGDVPPYVHAGPLTMVGLAFDHPVAGPFSLSSAFGWRANPTGVGPAVQFHIGLDYAVACGTPVRTAADGTVVSAGERGTGGLRIDIDHGDGLVTSYRHNSRLLVSPGDRVGRGDVISMSGTTGNSTGCHLHFDATLDGQYVDPVHLLPEVAGQPRALDAEDLERIRAAEKQGAPAVPPERVEAAPWHDGQTAEQGPVARPAPHRAETQDADTRAPRTPAADGPAQRPQLRTPSQKPASPGASSTQPASKPSGTPKQDQSTPVQPAPEPSGTAKPEKPEKPTPPNAPETPAATDPTEPAHPTRPGPSVPTTPEPTEPEPTEPATPEPIEPSTPQPSEPTEPTEPATPEPIEPSTPQPSEPTEPTEPATPEPAQPATPKAPEALTDQEAARWCLPLDDDAEEETPDFSEIFTGDFADLVGLVAVLDDAGEPESVTEEILIEMSPSALWLESLPACSDAEFMEAAFEIRSAG